MKAFIPIAILFAITGVCTFWIERSNPGTIFNSKVIVSVLIGAGIISALVAAAVFMSGFTIKVF